MSSMTFNKTNHRKSNRWKTTRIKKRTRCKTKVRCYFKQKLLRKDFYH